MPHPGLDPPEPGPVPFRCHGTDRLIELLRAREHGVGRVVDRLEVGDIVTHSLRGDAPSGVYGGIKQPLGREPRQPPTVTLADLMPTVRGPPGPGTARIEHIALAHGNIPGP